jgi:hypothetical protein
MAEANQREARRQFVMRLRQHGSDVHRLTNGLDDAMLECRTESEKWSLKELVCHLLCVEQLFQQRIDCMLDQAMPSFTSYAPEQDPSFTSLVATYQGRQTVEAFVAHREGFARRLAELSPNEWRRQGIHPRFGIFDVDFLIEYMVHHDAHHVYQLFMRRIPLAHRRRS